MDQEDAAKKEDKDTAHLMDADEKEIEQKMIKTILNVRTSDVVILSVQSSSQKSRIPRRIKRDEKRALPAYTEDMSNETVEPELEVLFVIKKGNLALWVIANRHQSYKAFSTFSA